MHDLIRRCAWAVLLASVGCGGETTTQPAAPATPSAPAPATADNSGNYSPPPLQMVLTSNLPETNEIPDLDDGRLDGAVPVDWHLARSPEYVLQCRRRLDADYPILMVSVKPETGQADLTRDNVAEFAAAVAAELAEDPSLAETRLRQQVTPVKIGNFIGVEYAHGAATAKNRLHRYFLVTVANGRRYTVELRALEGTQQGYVSAAQAMAANLKFKPAE